LLLLDLPKKLVPILEPFSFAALGQYTESLTRQAYSNKLRNMPLLTCLPGTRNGLGVGVTEVHPSSRETLTPFQRLAQYEKCAEVVNLVHMLEPLIARGYIKVEINKKSFADRKISYKKILKTKSPADLANNRRQVFHLASLLGLVDEGLLDESITQEAYEDVEMDVGVDKNGANELQQDVFMTSKYPRIPPELVDLYRPNLNYANVKGVASNANSRTQKRMKKANDNYENLCKNSREGRDVSRSEFERAHLARIVCMNLTVCNPHITNPRTDGFIAHGGWV